MNRWIDVEKILSYKRKFNFILSDRTAGKTYGVTKHLVKNFLETKQKFIVLKRNEVDIDNVRGWGNKVIREQFPDHELNLNKRTIFIDGEKAGIFLPLSTSINIKDNDISDYYFIFYDDFVILPGSTKRYLKHEGFLFTELYSTVDRLRDETIFIGCGNSITNFNPLFEYYGIKAGRDAYTFGKSWLIYKAEANDLRREAFENTALGDLTKGSHYSDYYLGKETYYSQHGVEDKNGKMSGLFNLIIDGDCFIFWSEKGGFRATKGFKETLSTFAMKTEDLILNSTVLDKETHDLIKEACRMNCITYDSDTSKMKFVKYF